MRRAALSVFLVAALTCLVSGQQPPVKTITTGVVVDVTVVDAKGNAVLDLAPEDFEVSEDGVRQRVVSATLVQRGVVRPLAATAASDQTASPLTGAPAAASAPATAVALSVTAILFDRLSPESRPLAHRAALAYISTLEPPHDYAGVFLADSALRTFQPFTNERAKLGRAVDAISATAPANMAAAAEPERKRLYGLDPNLPPTAGAESSGAGLGSIAEREYRLKNMEDHEKRMVQMALRMSEGYARFVAELDGQWSLAGLRAVVSGLSELPGRKSILYFAENLPITDRLKPKFDALIGDANRANITV